MAMGAEIIFHNGLFILYRSISYRCWFRCIVDQVMNSHGIDVVVS